MRVYKVTSPDLTSYTITYGPGSVKYAIGKKTVPQPKCGPLCAFMSLKHAKDFVSKYRDGRIFEAEARPSEKSIIDWIWTPERDLSYADLPPGTVL